MSVKVYLDTCSLQRPLDSRTQIRISLEAEAVMGIIALLEEGRVELASSDVLLFEVQRNPHFERCVYALGVLEKASTFVPIDSVIRQRAAELKEKGLNALDALHLAAAEVANVDYFCTTDDRLLKRGKSLVRMGTRIVSPVELIEELE